MPSLENMTTEQLQESTRLFQTLLDSPDTRELTLRMIQKKTGKPIAELHVRDTAMAEIAKEREEREKLAARIQERDIRDRIKDERERVKREHQLTDQDMSAVEKLMTDEKAPIPHYDAAAKVYKASQTVAQPTTSLLTPKTWDMPEKDVWAAGIGNRQALNKIATEEAYKALNEFRSGAMK